ncbi:23 kDa integral membrane protein-like [Vanessa atalanta]|uniref:23 kDa integral membrane protein-like n=1 Tax=Vanessa atalanta TaxID=42275 RepID=UPI001FCCCE31|nr:23 kDa integral membrane protein-like [Vanessa atalanta]
MFVDVNNVSRSCAKTLLLLLNGCCILVALCTFIFAVVDTKILQQYGEDRASGTFTGDIIIIVACMLLICLASFGSVGAMKGDVKILYFYIGFLMIMVILEMMIAIYVSLQRYGLEFKVSEWLREDFFRNTTDDIVHNDLWDNLQITYECCGLNGPDDYEAVRKQISLSCCPRAFRARTAYARQQLYRSCVESSTFYNDGCEDEILYALRSDANWLVGVAITSFWFEAACMLLAMWVANNSRKEVSVYVQSIRY